MLSLYVVCWLLGVLVCGLLGFLLGDPGFWILLAGLVFLLT